MKHINLRLGLSTFAVTGLVFFSAAPIALAHEGGSAKASEDTVATTTETDTSGTSGTETEPQADPTDVKDLIAKHRADGQERLAALRAKAQVKSTEARQKACEQRKVSIDNRLSAYNKAANTTLTEFNNIFERVKKFKTDKSLQVSNYDTLVATATAKQVAATDAVAALKDLSANFDCTSTDPAATVASIKSATVGARTALKDYRTAIKNIVVALAQVNKTATGSTTTTTTTGTTTEAN